MNRAVPEVQVLMQPSWIKFDPEYFTGTLEAEREEKGSLCSLEAALDLAPLSMGAKRLQIREKVHPMAPQELREAYLIRHWKGGVSVMNIWGVFRCQICVSTRKKDALNL